MDKAVRFILFGIVLLALILFMTTYTVRYDQYSIVTTFGRVGDASDVLREGLHWKLPTPIQQVRRFDSRIRVLETRLEDHQTRDKQQITVQAFLAWRISDPVRFFQSYSGHRADQLAIDMLHSRMKTAMGSVSEYAFIELLAPSGTESKLEELEGKVIERVREAEGDQIDLVQQVGIEVVSVGITRIILPENTTKKVFERMREVRIGLAGKIRTEGEAEKTRIISAAMSDADKILAFANRLATKISSMGEQEAKQWIALQAEDEELAIFMRSMDALKDFYSKQVTLVTSEFPFSLLSGSARDELSNSRGIPIPNYLEDIPLPGRAAVDSDVRDEVNQP